MDLKQADKRLLNFADGRILVVGDVILDEFLYGEADRISPEAPVPVVDVQRHTTQLGGAANVVNNLVALGAKAALCGVIGNDDGGNRVLKLLHELNVPTDGAVVEIGRPTTVKTRVIAAHQQVVRFDREDRSPLQGARKKLMQFIRRAQKNFNAIIISDYGKGVVSEEVVAAVLEAGRKQGIPVLVDPKPGNIHLYKGVTAITPNVKEAGESLGRALVNKHEPVEQAGRDLLARIEGDMVLLTRGDQGMTLFRKDSASHHIPTRARQVFDVTGAGDTVIATFTLALTAGASPAEAAELANHAAGVVVGKLGTATATPVEIRDALAVARQVGRDKASGKEK